MFIILQGDLERVFLVLQEKTALERVHQKDEELGMPPVDSLPVVVPKMAGAAVQVPLNEARGLKRDASQETQETPISKRR